MWTSAGVIFALGVGASLLVARTKGWVLLKPSKKESALFALITAIGYPLCIVVMVAVINLYSTLYRLSFADSWVRRVNAGEGIAIDAEGIYVGKYCAAVAAAVIVSFALWIVSTRWDSTLSVLLMVAGLGTVFLSYHLPSGMEHYTDSLMVLFIVGHTLFTGLSGSWLARAQHLAALEA